ncbi:hypothetical protein [Vibrio phage VP16C]|nr:hypothetical protein [Vibrio phage VP16C]
MTNNAKTTDEALDAIRGVKGLYAQPISNYTASIKILDSKNLARLTVELPLDQLSDRRDARMFDPRNPMFDTLKMVPFLAFVDVSEFEERFAEPTAAPKLGANGENVETEFLKSDYLTHHDDFVRACEIARDASDGEGGELYWQRQINTLARLAEDYPFKRG